MGLKGQKMPEKTFPDNRNNFTELTPERFQVPQLTTSYFRKEDFRKRYHKLYSLLRNAERPR